MATLVYIHGFLSSPRSLKAQQTRKWLLARRPEIRYRCPTLSPYPQECERQLRELMAELESEPVGLIGSSLGGFWATWLVETFADRPAGGPHAVLINPSVEPHALVDRVEGIPQQSYHSDTRYTLTREHAEQFRQARCEPLHHPERLWLLAQTGDETLDYRQAVERYRGCRQSIEEGGDHSFQGYMSYLPEIARFLFP